MYDHGREGISGLRTFEGEDLHQGDRRKMQQLQMKDWIDQQTAEKKAFEDHKRFRQNEVSSLHGLVWGTRRQDSWDVVQSREWSPCQENCYDQGDDGRESALGQREER